MSTNTPPTPSTGASGTSSASGASATPAAPERVFVEIPKARPGQEYKAPKNYQQPLWDGLTRLITVVLCASLPLAPAMIFALVLGVGDNPLSRTQYLWIWIPMIVLVEAIALFVAIGVAREALGIAGSNGYTRRAR